MRKGKSKSRLIVPDPKFSDLMVTKFVNNIMLQGKKNSAFDIFYEAIELVTQRSKEDGLEVWKKALANVTPSVEVRIRRKEAVDWHEEYGQVRPQPPREIDAGKAGRRDPFSL
jgi:small subunit ribosomal protein S7